MVNSGVYSGLCAAKSAGNKRIAMLLDPDKFIAPGHDNNLDAAIDAGIDYFFIGGSLIANPNLDAFLESVRERCDIPLVLFPGSFFQLSYRADALLFLSLISGRNPELLIGQHVIAAPFLKLSPLEIISTGYMLVDGGVNTSVQYMSNTAPIPHNKNDIAVSTALAGEMLGLRALYLEAGSGARNPVSGSMISDVSRAVSIPVIVGGVIRSADGAADAYLAGADLVVVGNALEKDPGLIRELAAARY